MKGLVPLAVMLAASACSISAQDGACGDEESLGTATSDLDSACTADPTKGLATITGYSHRWESSYNPDGFDMANLTALGPTCGFGVNRNDDCCETNAGTASYTACKNQQEQNAIAFIQAFQPNTPLTLPWGSTAIEVGSGYYYNNDGPHAAAIDVNKASIATGEDPSFPVVAAGDGEVVYSDWYGGTAGNIVIVRHPLWDGTFYITEYRHVRGGAARDKQKFCPCLTPAATTEAGRLASCTTAQRTKQCLYAAKPQYDRFWGSSSDALPALGTRVRPGTFLVMAGNTGTVTDHINDDGTISKDNTHLHFSLGVRTGTVEEVATTPDVVTLDVFGVYSKASGTKNGLGCYALNAPTTFPHLIKPFDPDSYASMRNMPGISCRATGTGTLTYSDGTAANTTLANETVVCPAVRPTMNGTFPNLVFGRVWVDDRSTTGDICCHVFSKNATGGTRSAPPVCSTSTGKQSLTLDYPKLFDDYTYSQFGIQCTLPAKTGSVASSIHTYRVQQQLF